MRKKSSIALRTLLVAAIASLVVVSLFLKDTDQPVHKFIEPPRERVINILWAQWKPADYLQILAHDFTRETGIRVNVFQRPWGEWQQHFFSEMAQRSDFYDLVVGDSQWLGMGATQGHYIDLTQWYEAHHVAPRFEPVALQGYSEYPKGSGRYWSVPLEGDVMGFAYRRDLFENPHEQARFLARYGYPLAVPETWFQLRDIAEHFYRPTQGLWGIMAWQEPHYDGLTMALQSVIRAWGAGIGDPATHQVRGILNTAEAADALRFYKQLTTFGNPEWRDYYLDTEFSADKPLMGGQVAMAMVYFAITPELLNPQLNPYSDSIGFFPVPAGPQDSATSLGGQGISLISYSKRKEHALRFLEWFIQQEVQQQWSDSGGLSCAIEVLESERFLQNSPMHRPFSESFIHARDFWTVPEYPTLLQHSQLYFHRFMMGSLSAEDALDSLASEWEEVFEHHGYYRE